MHQTALRLSREDINAPAVVPMLDYLAFRIQTLKRLAVGHDTVTEPFDHELLSKTANQTSIRLCKPAAPAAHRKTCFEGSASTQSC